MQYKGKIHRVKNDKFSQYLDHSNDSDLIKTQNISILPHPATLESYEAVIPGITLQLCNLIEKEQKHRHALEIQAVQSMIKLTRLGQLLTIPLALLITYTTIVIADKYSNTLAIFIYCFGFGTLCAVSLYAWRSAKYLLQNCNEKTSKHRKHNTKKKRRK